MISTSFSSQWFMYAFDYKYWSVCNSQTNMEFFNHHLYTAISDSGTIMSTRILCVYAWLDLLNWFLVSFLTDLLLRLRCMENVISHQSNQTVTTNLAKGFSDLTLSASFRYSNCLWASFSPAEQVIPTIHGCCKCPCTQTHMHVHNWHLALSIVLLSAVKLDCMPLLRTWQLDL